jgi:hypothetical protein
MRLEENPISMRRERSRKCNRHSMCMGGSEGDKVRGSVSVLLKRLPSSLGPRFSPLRKTIISPFVKVLSHRASVW